MKKLKFVCSAMLVCGLMNAAWAELEPVKGSVSERLDSLEAKTNSAFGKAGILFGGEFYSRALSSKIDGNLVKGQTAKTTENLLFTGVDLSIEARPLDAIGGIAVIRMHQDWRNMFGSMANPLTLRWIAINGNARDLLTYSIGDFKQKYSPFTLWTPEPQILFEPTIFARQREITMGEEFLGGNNRILQGANLNFGAKVSDNFQELRLGAFGARLRQAGEARGMHSGVPSAVAEFDVNMDRYATGFNADMKFIPGTQVGGTFMYLGDAKKTSILNDENTWNSANNNMVFSGRARAGSELFAGIDADAVMFGLNADFAGSNYTTYRWVSANRQDDSTLFGTAFKGSLDGKFRFGQNGLNLNAGFLANSQEFRNELAQSPALYNRGILNSAVGERFVDNRKVSYFNTFDALYTSVFTYMPGESELDGGTKQPMRKSAWTRSTLTWDEIVSNPGLIERNLSGALPLGEATPNRQGLVANLDLDFIDRAILVSGLFNLLSEMQEDTIFSPRFRNKQLQSFTEFGGGLSLNVARFGDWWAHPFIISGSFKQTIVDNYLEWGGRETRSIATADRNSGIENNISFINAGVYWKFWRRAALMGGYQIINSEVSDTRLNLDMATNQSQWAAGFEYSISEGSVVNATIGQVAVAHSASSRETDREVAKGNFNSLRLDLNMRVKF